MDMEFWIHQAFPPYRTTLGYIAHAACILCSPTSTSTKRLHRHLQRTKQPKWITHQISQQRPQIVTFGMVGYWKNGTTETTIWNWIEFCRMFVINLPSTGSLCVRFCHRSAIMDMCVVNSICCNGFLQMFLCICVYGCNNEIYIGMFLLCHLKSCLPSWRPGVHLCKYHELWIHSCNYGVI